MCSFDLDNFVVLDYKNCSAAKWFSALIILLQVGSVWRRRGSGVMGCTVAGESEDAQRLRFQIELEFVQCLANPNYLLCKLQKQQQQPSLTLKIFQSVTHDLSSFHLLHSNTFRVPETVKDQKKWSL